MHFFFQKTLKILHDIRNHALPRNIILLYIINALFNTAKEITLLVVIKIGLTFKAVKIAVQLQQFHCFLAGGCTEYRSLLRRTGFGDFHASF